MPRQPAPQTAIPLPRQAWRGGRFTDGIRVVPAEVPVALTYNRMTHAVMLATPGDLEDFAIGFSLSEEIITAPSDVLGLDIVEVPEGIELRMDLAADRLEALTRRQRRLAGPSGCGLCGLDSLAAAVRAVPKVPQGLVMTPADIEAAMRSMQPAQALNAATRAVHAAGFWTRHGGLRVLREDVGRHNALDKLAGALARNGGSGGNGVVVLSSRISVEMVQKAAMMGTPMVMAVSVPTALAIRQADMAGITLIGIARADGFEAFTHPERISADPVSHVA